MLSSVVRIATHRAIFKTPSSLEILEEFTGGIRAVANAVQIEPGPRHWDIFLGLLKTSGARGADVTDAWIAAMAIESGCRLLTTDGSFGRFRGLHWAHPLEGE